MQKKGDFLMKVYIKKVDGAEDLPLPRYMTKGASGMDLYANVTKDVVIKPGEFKMIPTGLQVALPRGFEGQVRPRSGLAYKKGITVLNSPGTIDEDYRGEIKVILINLGKQDFVIHRGDRIAQLILSKVYKAEVVEVDSLNKTERGSGGFGHTGI